MASIEITLTLEELDDERYSAIKAKIIYQIENKLAEENYQDFYVTTEIITDIFQEVLNENPEFFYLSVDDCSVSCSGNYFMETGIKWAKKLKIFYPEIKRISRGANIPNKIFRVVNGELTEPDRIYKCINNKLILFWES